MNIFSLVDDKRNENGELISWVPDEGISKYFTNLTRVDLDKLKKGISENDFGAESLEKDWGHYLRVELQEFITKKEGNYVYFDMKKISARITAQLVSFGDWRDMSLQYKTLIYNTVYNLLSRLNHDKNKTFVFPKYREFLAEFIFEDLKYLEDQAKQSPFSLLFNQTEKESSCEWHFRLAQYLTVRINQDDTLLKEATRDFLFQQEVLAIEKEDLC